ncbi:MAG: pyridoxamine 5'-phosphate oxidase family protein [Candidatus Omnitrophica bacterium]|nr:pyridoxamine 5'-phosphate oxidase family protein [Candidatus Omnitrophota bacterium]
MRKMQPQIKRAVAMAKEVGHLFLATADAAGTPHIAVVKDIAAGPGDSVLLTMWPCQSTFANLEKNPNVSLVVWQPARDTGYQLVGRLEDIESVAVLNGYLPGLENKKHYPQEEIKVRVRVQKVLNFQQAPHLDVRM